MAEPDLPSDPCAYCGSAAHDRDHVPPKCLFPEPRPADLITVPACRPCNGGRGTEDEWFKALLFLRADLQGHPAVQKLLPGVFRSWRRPQARHVTRALVDSLREVVLKTPSGLHLGTAPAYLIEHERLIAYLERLVRGLFFHESNSRLPSMVKVTASVAFQSAPEIRREALPMLDGRPVRSIGEGIFRYAWNHVPEDSTTSIWVVEFDERVPFLIVTVSERARAAVATPAV